VGCALAGLYAEVALICGLPVRATVAALTGVSLGLGLWRSRALVGSVSRAVAEWLPIYLVAVLAASISPFPVLGNWEGDWMLLYKMGQSVMDGVLPADMLARPPLFGGAATPLWILWNGLIPYQLMAAVASAAAVTATFSFIEELWPETPISGLIPLLVSPFFLHHTAAAWSKLLAAALILSAVMEALNRRRLSSGALFALAMGVHEGSVIWGPCVLLAHAAGTRRWRDVWRAIPPMAMMAILVVAPLQIWILAKYGLAAKIAANPAVAEARHGSFLTKTVLAIVSSFVGWGPVLSIARWSGNPHPGSSAVVAKEGYWLITTYITTLAGNAAGLLFPFFFVRATRTLPSRPPRIFNSWLVAGAAIAVLANALLTPFYGYEGTMQVGLVALGLGLFATFAGQLSLPDRAGAQRPIRRLTWIMGLVGTLPWLLLNGGTSAGLWLSPSFRERFRAGSEGDYLTVLKNHLSSLGTAAFPQVPLLCVVLLAAWLYLGTRRGWLGRRPPSTSSEA
jgi:hypothetical protein